MVTSRTLIFFLLTGLMLAGHLQADERLGMEAYKRHHFDIAYREFNAAAATSHQAQFYLGQMFERGEGMEGPNAQRAIRWYLKAAEGGYIEAAAALGALFASGKAEQLPKNYPEAMRWLSRAAEKGHGDAAARLGGFYLIGRGGVKNEALGVAWLRVAKAEGSERAEIQLEQLKEKLPASVFENAKKLQPELMRKGQGRHE